MKLYLYFVIFRKSIDIIFLTNLSSQLSSLGLNLQGLPTETSNTPNPDRSRMLEIILGVLSGVLAVALLSIIIVFIIKLRNFNRQIKVLNESSYDSTPPEMMQNNQKLPNTNIFASEKSNPVMNNTKMHKNDLDTQSIISSDSDDFAGLHDNPIFNINHDVNKPVHNSSFI